MNLQTLTRKDLLAIRKELCRASASSGYKVALEWWRKDGTYQGCGLISPNSTPYLSYQGKTYCIYLTCNKKPRTVKSLYDEIVYELNDLEDYFADRGVDLLYIA